LTGIDLHVEEFEVRTQGLYDAKSSSMRDKNRYFGRAENPFG